MTATGTTLAAWLESSGAQHDLVGWARAFSGDSARAWAECPRGDWMLAIAARAGVARPRVVEAACECARVALTYVGDGDAAAERAIAAAERWAREGATDDLAAAARAACEEASRAADVAPDPAWRAATIAAVAAASAIDDPDAAAGAAAAAAEAAVYDAGDCAMMPALAYTQSQCAKRVRALIPWIAIEVALG